MSEFSHSIIAQDSGNRERCLAAQHVPRVQQFVQEGGAQEAAKTGQPIPVGQQVALCIRGIGHGAELDEGERLTVQAGPLLAEEDG